MPTEKAGKSSSIRTTGLDIEMAKGMARSGQRRGEARRGLARGSNKNDGIVLTSLLWASFVRMKVQIAEARLRGDIETRGFLPREYFRRATRPTSVLPLSYHPRHTQLFLESNYRRCVLNFLRNRFPFEFPARIVLPKFYRLQYTSVSQCNNYSPNAPCP